MKKQTLAVTTVLTVILILISAIIGALIAYTWAMAPFYLEPQNSVDLLITDLNFQASNAKYFGITIMNPSHSITDTNITDIYITAPGFNVTSATSTNPSLPLPIARGTTQTLNCSLQWGAMAGRLLTVHVASSNSTGAEQSVQTESVSLAVTPIFDPSKSIDYFNVSVTSISSPVNVTVNQVLLDFAPVNSTSLTISLPQVIQPGGRISFTCNVRWEGYVNPTVSIQTVEGYSAKAQAEARGSVDLEITNITFGNLGKVDLTVSNGETSATAVQVSRIIFKHGNTTDVIAENQSTPALPITINVNQTVSLECSWPWSQATNRDLSITINANTTQGFVSTTSTVSTPARVAVSIDAVNFDLDNTGSFTVNVTNWQDSLNSINLTSVNVNNTVIPVNQILAAGQTQTFSCAFNWSSFVGQKIEIMATYTYDSTGASVLFDTTVPYVKLVDAIFAVYLDNTPYVSMTVRNSEFSKVNATIMSAQAKVGNLTFQIAGAIGYEVDTGAQIVIACPWNWKPYSGQNVTLTVFTQDGASASATFGIE